MSWNETLAINGLKNLVSKEVQTTTAQRKMTLASPTHP
jgi:hypothetical protein